MIYQYDKASVWYNKYQNDDSNRKDITWLSDENKSFYTTHISYWCVYARASKTLCFISTFIGVGSDQVDPESIAGETAMYGIRPN